MEQTRYLMWGKRKNKTDHSHVFVSSVSSNGDSWEEQAFAEDAAGALGGCTWPPRSYSCSFCRREFRSAQALGGHMNVHRRDRARLKLSPIPQSEVLQFPPQLCNLLYNPNPDFSNRVSNPPTTANLDEKIPTRSLSSQILEDNQKTNTISSTHPPSWSSFVAEKNTSLLDLYKEDRISKSTLESNTKAKRNCSTTDLDVKRSQTNESSTSDEEIPGCKRRRIEVRPFMFLQRSSSVERCHSQLEVIKVHSSTIEELDLELRLGDAPKVK